LCSPASENQFSFSSVASATTVKRFKMLASASTLEVTLKRTAFGVRQLDQNAFA
jgi:hypothetical protein